MNPQQTRHGKIALEFANALVAGNFARAEQLLSATAKKQWPIAVLQSSYLDMVSYFDTPPTFTEVMNTLEDWPAKQANDIGWAYVAIAGVSESEALTVIVCSENSNFLIRDIEWGRP